MVEIKREIYEQGSMGRKRIKPWTLRRITYVGKSLGWMKGGRHGWMGRWVDGGCSSKQKRMDHTAKFACQVGWAGGIDDDVDVADKERFHLKGLVVLLVVSFRWKTALQTWTGEQMAFPSWRRWPLLDSMGTISLCKWSTKAIHSSSVDIQQMGYVRNKIKIKSWNMQIIETSFNRWNKTWERKLLCRPT